MRENVSRFDSRFKSWGARAEAGRSVGLGKRNLPACRIAKTHSKKTMKTLIAFLAAFVAGIASTLRCGYLPHAAECGALTLVSTGGCLRGVASEETGINVEEVSVTIKPEFKEYLMNKTNEKIGFAVAPAELEMSVKGEISNNTGLVAAVFGTATSIANTTAYAGAPTTGKYLDEMTVVQGRAAWKNMDAKFSAAAGIA